MGSCLAFSHESNTTIDAPSIRSPLSRVPHVYSSLTNDIVLSTQSETIHLLVRRKHSFSRRLNGKKGYDWHWDFSHGTNAPARMQHSTVERYLVLFISSSSVWPGTKHSKGLRRAQLKSAGARLAPLRFLFTVATLGRLARQWDRVTVRCGRASGRRERAYSRTRPENAKNLIRQLDEALGAMTTAPTQFDRRRGTPGLDVDESTGQMVAVARA